ncbi:WD-40 repeat-containing protein, partial [Reticulomyxa filosa]
NKTFRKKQNKKMKLQQPKNQDDSSSIMSSGTNNIHNFDSFCSSSKLLKTFTGHTDIVYSIDYSTFDDGQFICSGSKDHTVRVWYVDNNKQIRSFNEHSSCVYCVKFSQYHYYNNKHRHVICFSLSDNTIRFWDFKHNKQLQ